MKERPIEFDILKKRIESLTKDEKQLLSCLLKIGRLSEFDKWTSKGIIRTSNEKGKKYLIKIGNERENRIKKCYNFIKKFPIKKWRAILIKVHESDDRMDKIIKALETYIPGFKK